jgi:hypothetical protein
MTSTYGALHTFLEDAACRVQFPVVPHSPTRLDFHDTLPFDKQRGRAQRPVSSRVVDRGLSRCACYIPLPPPYRVL